jgi:hypothetical protein
MDDDRLWDTKELIRRGSARNPVDATRKVKAGRLPIPIKVGESHIARQKSSKSSTPCRVFTMAQRRARLKPSQTTNQRYDRLDRPTKKARD